MNARKMSRSLIVAGIAVIAGIAWLQPGSAEARANAPYCLQMSAWHGPQGLRCAFASFAQCQASRAAQTDFCVLNPATSVRP